MGRQTRLFIFTLDSMSQSQRMTYELNIVIVVCDGVLDGWSNARDIRDDSAHGDNIVIDCN